MVLRRRVFQSEAYELLVDAWRVDSPKVTEAVRAWKMHIHNYARPDMRAFMICIFGLERMMQLLKLDDKDN